MKCGILSLALCLLAAMLLSASHARSTPANSWQNKETALHPLADNYWSNTPVRLRRLHLVRPDLIPYPLVNEAIC